ncbi:hypothetical protein CONPUDRAFT_163145 [Coniophora puteana RWD-64-598 SS2]|uniref:Uncharacterized protein n=1 Tax=Coniophora puteana (strain RWD-64-598) TaxID=741705 RepID=A0A5M3MXP7_CONPW|nr:uncharacterized protein CONPUDRAFT_163145 [Coniophora puteana RWD-64-598 SS2]EIW83880.1 hypothetical protein CONPUDRAFT_163145 [Coniophora puteana RWD-64-598 SS2]
MSSSSNKEVPSKGTKRGDTATASDTVPRGARTTGAVNPPRSAPPSVPQLNLPADHSEDAGNLPAQGGSRSRKQTAKSTPTRAPTASEISSLLSPESAYDSDSKDKITTAQGGQLGENTGAVVVKPTNGRWSASVALLMSNSQQPQASAAFANTAVADLLKECWDYILIAVAHTRRLQELSKSEGIPEAEWRRPWDGLIESVFLLVKMGKLRFMVEKTIKMSRSQLALGTTQVVKQVAELCLQFSGLHNRFKTRRRASRNLDLGHEKLNDADATKKAAFVKQHAQAAQLFQSSVDITKCADEAKERMKYDPSTAKCDALVTLAFNLDGFEDVADAERSKFSLFHEAEGKDDPICPQDSLMSTDVLSHSSMATQSKNLAHDIFCLNTPSAGLGPEYAPPAHIGASSSEPTLVTPEHKNVLHLPFFVVEYKKGQSEHDAGSNQTRLYLNAAASYLAAAGILEQPVFGLTTNGQHGVLSCAYARRDTNNLSDPTHIMILERNAMVFDLANPLSCAHFASCLCYMAVHLVPGLQAKATENLAASHLVTRIVQKELSTQWILLTVTSMIANLDLSSVLYLPLTHDSIPQDIKCLLPSSSSLESPTKAIDERKPLTISAEVLDSLKGLSSDPASLVAYGARISEPDVFVIEKATFATSRPCREDYAGLASFYPLARIASLLVMRVTSEDAARRSVLTASRLPLRATDDAWHDGSETTSDSSDFRTARSRVTSESSIPLQTSWQIYENTDPISHYSLFADYRDFGPSVPVVCVAEDDAIISLLRSAVYQRLAWGMSTPIVGVTLYPRSPVVQVLLAWPGIPAREDSLPMVNIASNPSRQANSGAGWFDLSSPNAAAAFVRYISDMVEHEAHAFLLAPSSQVEPFEWRSDYVDHHARLASIYRDKSASLYAWAKDALGSIPEPNTPSTHLAFDEEPESLPDSPEDVAYIQRSTHADITTGASNINQPFTTVTRWLWDRLATTQSVLPFVESGTIPASYISLTRFAWSDDWDGSAPLPDSVAEYSHLRSRLLDMKQADSALTDQTIGAGITLGEPTVRVCEDPYDVRDLASSDPIYGFCDSVATLCLPNFVTSQASRNLRHAAENFALLRKGPAPKAVAYWHGVCDVNASRFQFAAAQNLFHAYVRSSCPQLNGLYELPEETLQLEHIERPPSLPPSASMTSENEAGIIDDDESASSSAASSLELPLLFVNHTPPEKAIAHVGAHQHRMCAASGAAFFGAAGLNNVPVFSLVTNGTQGVLTCAWAEVYDGFQRIRIAERNGVLFDLTNPLSAFHFAAFLVRLKHEHGRLLRERLDEPALARLRERLEQGEYETRWTMSHYVDEQERLNPS